MTYNIFDNWCNESVFYSFTRNRLFTYVCECACICICVCNLFKGTKAIYILVKISALNFMCKYINMELIMLSVKDWIMNRKTGWKNTLVWMVQFRNDHLTRIPLDLLSFIFFVLYSPGSGKKCILNSI